MSLPSLDGVTSKAVTISNETMISTLLVLFFVVAFCFFLHLYVQFYWPNNIEDPNTVAWRRQLARQRLSSLVPMHRQGLDPAAIQSLPIVVYNPKDFKEQLECAVCLSEVSEGEKARLLPKCNHVFHVKCIDMWFQSHSTCPLCRNPVISTIDTSNNISNINVEVQIDVGDYSPDSYSDSDDGSYASPRAREAQVFPINVMFRSNETQVSSFGLTGNAAAGTAAASASTSSGVNRLRDQDMVIEIPSHEFCDGCLSSSQPEEEAKTPVMTRLRSFKRLLSVGKRVAPSPHGV